MTDLTAELAEGAVIVECPEPGCDHRTAAYGGSIEHHDDGSHTFSYSRRPLIVADPDLHALALTVGHATDLLEHDAPAEHWAALTSALVAEHTPEQLANMLTGACALIARTANKANT